MNHFIYEYPIKLRSKPRLASRAIKFACSSIHSLLLLEVIVVNDILIQSVLNQVQNIRFDCNLNKDLERRGKATLSLKATEGFRKDVGISGVVADISTVL